MGLGAPKRRNKISHDPNNTSWSKSSDTYGHRILSTQGWKPGDYLGASDASHSDHYTAADASHIKVLLREDNLGLGAKIGGKGNAETFGLSLFSGVLGRLNGKSDVELEKQQGALRDAELRSYQVQKHGMMNFVSGGLLVGDQIEPVAKRQKTEKTVVTGDAEHQDCKKGKSEEDPRMEYGKKRKTKKSKIDRLNGHLTSKSSVVEATKSRERKKRQRRRIDGSDEQSHELSEQMAEANASANARTETTSSRHSRESIRQTGDDSQNSTESAIDDERSRKKQEKRARKEERRRRKEEKRVTKNGPVATDSEQADQASPSENKPVELPIPTSALVFRGNRHSVRHRYIQQKRLASMDPQAMKEIFMLTASA